MRSFWMGLWLRWALWLTLFSLVSSGAAAVVLTLVIYAVKGMPPLESEIVGALGEIAWFWFPVFWSLTLLLGFFLSVKGLFYRCVGGYMLALYGCDGKEMIEEPGVGDTLKLWRKWFFVMIWAVAAQVVGGVAASYVAGITESLMAWFSIYWLYGFILTAGLATLPLMAARCKMVKVKSC